MTKICDKEFFERSKLTLVGIGSNTTSRVANVEEATKRLSEFIDIQFDSGVFDSEPLSGKGSPYANRAIAGHTSLTFDQLNARLKAEEIDSGRDKSARERGEVPIDLDIVVFEGATIRPNEFGRDYFNKAMVKMCDTAN